MSAIKDMDKAEMIWLLIAALNDGSREAMNDAQAIRERAKEMGDHEFEEVVEYYWNVI